MLEVITHPATLLPRLASKNTLLKPFQEFGCFEQWTKQCSVIVQSLSCVWLLQPHGLQHARLPCSSPSLGAYSNLCPLSRYAAAAKLLQSCATLCDPIDGSPPGSPIPGILQARTLEWVAISFSNAGKWKVKVKSLSCVRLFVTPWTATHQAPPPVWFSRQEYWSGVPLPSPESVQCPAINTEISFTTSPCQKMDFTIWGQVDSSLV